MNAYIINMPDALERRQHLEKIFAPLDINAIFIEAIVGKEIELPDPRYSEGCYRKAHGKRTNPGELGCYFSHIKALEVFLDSEDNHAIICEDDIEFEDLFQDVIKEALEHEKRFDLLRISGLHRGSPVKIVSLKNGYSLSCCLTRQAGSGAYLVNRKAACKMIKALLPMWLPYDHAFDREWLWGVKSMCIDPMPVQQNIGFESQIDAPQSYKLPAFQRYITVFPYRAYNEISRIIARSFSIFNQKCRTRRWTQRTDAGGSS